MFRMLKKLTRNTIGATSIEYGLIAALLVIGVISSVKGVADETSGLWAIVSSRTSEATE